MKRKHGLLIADHHMAIIGPVLLLFGAVFTFTPVAGGFFLATLGGFYLLGAMAPHRERHRIGDPVAFFVGLAIVGTGFYLPSAELGRFAPIVLLVGTLLAFAGFFLGKEKEEPEVRAWTLYETPPPAERRAGARGGRGGRGLARPSHPASPGSWLFPDDPES